LAKGPPLKRWIVVENATGERALIRTVTEALAWIDLHAASDPSWARTRRSLSDAASDASLRKIRAATRAFEEAVAKAARMQAWRGRKPLQATKMPAASAAGKAGGGTIGRMHTR
jgi:hypothetical protein